MLRGWLVYTLATCLTFFGAARGSAGEVECPWRMASLQNPYDLEAQKLFLEEEIKRAELEKKHDNFAMNLYHYAQDLPYRPLIMIGEEHLAKYDYAHIVLALKLAQPKIDTLFLEVHSTYTPALEAFFDEKISYEDLARSFRWDNNVTRFLDKPFVELTRALGIKIVGVENPSTGSSFFGIMNTSERNTYSAQIIESYYHHFYEPRRDSWLDSGKPKLKEAQQAIYLGGAGHLMISGEDPFNRTPVRSLPQLLDGQVWHHTIYLLSDDASPFSLLRKQGLLVQNVLHAPIVFKPAADAPSVLPSVEGVSYNVFRWSQFDLVVIYPKDDVTSVPTK